MLKTALLAVAMLLPAAHVRAATVSIDVRGTDGKPLAGAVVVLDAPNAPAAVATGRYSVEQRDIQFQPHILIVPLGATVGFPNRDRVRHHVYSFSKVKKFDLKLYGREDQRSITFDRPGVVALGCNIHDTMSGFIYVTASPFARLSDADGHVALTGVPVGQASVTVWHPAIHAPGNRLSRPLPVGAQGAKTTLVIH